MIVVYRSRKTKIRVKLIRLLSKLEIRLSEPYNIGHGFEYKIWIIQKFTKNRVYILENHFQNVELSLADVMEIIRNIVDVPDSFEEYCNMVVGADEDNPIDREDYKDYRKRADRLSKVVTKKEIISIPVLRTLPEPKVIDENDAEDRDLIAAISQHNLNRAQKRGMVIIHLDNIYDYNRWQDYLKTIRYHKKLMKQYGYDERTEEFNCKLFPVPKEDRQLNGIKKDVDDFFKLLEDYNYYIRYLVQKYNSNVNEEELESKGVIILYESDSSFT